VNANTKSSHLADANAFSCDDERHTISRLGFDWFERSEPETYPNSVASFCSTVVWAGCQVARDLNVIIAFAPALCKLFFGGELVQSSDVASAPVAFCLHLPKNSTCKRSLQRSSNTKEICPARKSGSLLSCGSVGLASGLLNDRPTPTESRANRPHRFSLHRPLQTISQDSPSRTILGSQFSVPVRWNDQGNPAAAKNR